MESEKLPSFLDEPRYSPPSNTVSVKDAPSTERSKRSQMHNIKLCALVICLLLLWLVLMQNAQTIFHKLWSLGTALASLTCTHASPLRNGSHSPAHKATKPAPWPLQEFMTEDFKAPDLLVTKTGQTEDGYLFFTPHGVGTEAAGPAIMTDDNDLIWHGPSGDTTNLRLQHLSDGSPVISYWAGVSTDTAGRGYGEVVILDDGYAEVAAVCLKDAIITPGYKEYPCYADFHESFITERNSIILTSYNVTAFDLRPIGGPEHGWIFDSLFYEVEIYTGEVLFKWSALEHLDEILITTTHAPLKFGDTVYGHSQSNPLDWFHINSIQPLHDGYLVNSRHTFSFYKLDKQGHVEWRVQGTTGGDFTLDAGIHFRYQHQPRVLSTDNHTIQLELFNNDNAKFDHGTFPSTGLGLTLNTLTRHVSLAYKLQTLQDPLYADSQGSIQRLPNGNVLMGYGQLPVIREYDSQGVRVFEAWFGEEADGELKVDCYRAYRSGWHGRPRYKPKVVARRSGGLTNVYVSWNGATGVDHWTVWAGNSRTFMSEMARVRRSGFETVVPVEETVKFVSVVASAAGEEIGESEIVEVTEV